MAQSPTIYTGEDATLCISGLTHSVLAISDFSLTLSKGTAEQELLGSTGNYQIAGSLSCEGSLTSCKLHNTALGKLIANLMGSDEVEISGSCGSNSLHFDLDKCIITGFDFSLGTAGDITEGTVDFTHLEPYNISVQRTGLGYTRLIDN